jgi:hypothetical protein
VDLTDICDRGDPCACQRMTGNLLDCDCRSCTTVSKLFLLRRSDNYFRQTFQRRTNHMLPQKAIRTTKKLVVSTRHGLEVTRRHRACKLCLALGCTCLEIYRLALACSCRNPAPMTCQEVHSAYPALACIYRHRYTNRWALRNL